MEAKDLNKGLSWMDVSKDFVLEMPYRTLKSRRTQSARIYKEASVRADR